MIAEEFRDKRIELIQKSFSRREQTLKRKEIEKTISAIVGIALPLLKLLERISEIGTIYADDCWRHWRAMLYDHTFSEDNLKGKQRKLIKTEKVICELEKHRSESGIFVDQVKDKARKEAYEEQVLSKCDDILKSLRSRKKGR